MEAVRRWVKRGTGEGSPEFNAMAEHVAMVEGDVGMEAEDVLPVTGFALAGTSRECYGPSQRSPRPSMT